MGVEGKKKFVRKNPLVDTMTKEQFVKEWITNGQPPDDPYLRRLSKNGIPSRSPVSPELRTVAVAERMWKIRNDRVALIPILRSPKQVAACLEEFNSWRRGDGKYAEPGVLLPYSPYFLGKIIEGAVNYLEGRSTEISL